MGVIEIITLAIPLIAKYGPDFADGVRRMIAAASAEPATTAEEKAHLDRLLIEVNEADVRVANTPLPGQRQA